MRRGSEDSSPPLSGAPGEAADAAPQRRGAGWAAYPLIGGRFCRDANSERRTYNVLVQVRHVLGLDWSRVQVL